MRLALPTRAAFAVLVSYISRLGTDGKRLKVYIASSRHIPQLLETSNLASSI